MQEQINNSSMLKVGTILRETYRIDSYLSSGGFGNTYVATNIEFEERVAIKEFFMKGVTQRDKNQTTVSVSNVENHNDFLEQKEKFKKEARRLRKLKNDYIVSVHDLFEENGTAYYVMDLVDGENLAERLKRTGKPMTEEDVRELLPQILDALKTVHNTGIWHLDLKPANIMLTKEGQVKLIDFGASKQLNAKKGGATTSTAISYTNGYAPREQMEQNYDKFGPWTDIYALGATIYTLLTNKRPPLPTNIDDDMSEDKHFALPFPNGISNDFKDLVLTMMHTNKNQRPQNVEAIMAILSDSNKKGKDVCDTLSEETIVAPENNGSNKEQIQVLLNNKKTQKESLNKSIVKTIKTNKNIYTRLILSFAVIAIFGCIGWIIYNNSKEEKSLQQPPKHTFRTIETATKPINAKIKELYDVMKAAGADVGSVQEFNDYFLARGDKGYQNRYEIWKTFKDAGADVGENYEEFAKWLGLRPVKSVLKYQFFDKNGKPHTINKREYDAYSEDFAKQYSDVSMRMVAPDGKSRIVPIAKVKAAIKKDGYRMWLMRVGNSSREKRIKLKAVPHDNIHLLYNELKNSYELGSEIDFREYLSDPQKREALRKELEAEYDVGDFESFSKYLGFDTSMNK